MFRRPIFHTLMKRMREPRRFIQVLAGPRQSGKTTLARQVMEAGTIPVHYATADEPTLRDRAWVIQQWETARAKIADKKKKQEALFILDKAQKIPDWSEVVKRLWDEDTASKVALKVILLGSSPLLIQKGLSESLAGRFEVIPVTHWSYPEMRDAFGWDLEQFILFGGYPGSASLIEDQERWARYITDSLIETTISRDILLLTRIDKPALLRRLFHLCCDYSGQILSYQKMLGQLHDAGNTTTLAHYLDLLSGAGLVTGIQKFSGKRLRQRASSPKIIVLNTALVSALSSISPDAATLYPGYWGRMVETAVGAHLVNSSRGKNIEVFYWLERNQEVDFIAKFKNEVVAIEVKSGRERYRVPGRDIFSRTFHVKRFLLVGRGGIPIQDFLSRSIEYWFR